MDGRVYFCEDVSKIERVGGMFYLTDISGNTTITRAMRPATFYRCVHGAMALLREFEADHGGHVVEFGSGPH